MFKVKGFKTSFHQRGSLLYLLYQDFEQLVNKLSLKPWKKKGKCNKQKENHVKYFRPIT